MAAAETVSPDPVVSVVETPTPEPTKESTLENLMDKLRGKSGQYRSWPEMSKSLRVAVTFIMNQSPESQPKEWFPSDIISGDERIALLILNQPLQEECKLFVKRIWQSALFHVCVDGGANQVKELSDNEFPLIPELVCGDFDSATPEVLEFYRSKGVSVIHTPDQDETDFTKALRLTDMYLKDKKIEVSSIIAVVRNGDRLDHILGNLNTLYQAEEITSIPVLIMGNSSLTWLLSVGFHKIHITEKTLESHVGLIPLGSACKNVTTTGLKWNLTNGKMNFGGLISTCNLLDGSGEVTVATDTPLIWTMEVTMDKF